ncbi:peroxidase family protein [Qingshengfaniella alkalisoli]|uniref:Peroxidase n=1 Tax=Qingshengfaniella alkalisoli TaxID=2599296 RepID=A0A5B8J1D7_9RHOB|nr:peroxidase family protein [Qingshengfaniella alkalisoli]QDY71593.1 peroxidase [Qingshengfaniella alkalisoli]
MAEEVLDKILGWVARRTDRLATWHKFPFPVALGIVLGHRVNLRNGNLSDTETAPPALEKCDDPGLPEGFDHREFRTPDGSFNDLDQPWMGRAGQRFGRNVPLIDGFCEAEDRLMSPSPRLVSNKLMARREFIPVPHLNLLAAAWIQFMVHDWLGHGANDKTKVREIPLPEGDDWPGRKMTVLATSPKDNVSPADDGRPDTFCNIETHWWDGSQLYGSSWSLMERLRTTPDGKRLDDGTLYLDNNGLLPLDDRLQDKRPGQELSGVNGNWWAGLSVLHTLFAREHNAIAARLRAEYPYRDGEWVFQKARLVNAALMAKIHTVEWTPALMDSPVGRMAMRGNFWGLTGERLTRAFGRISNSEVIGGIPGSQKDHHDVPYAMTEEFTSVYRLHCLLPDDFTFRSADDDGMRLETDLNGVAFGNARKLYDQLSFNDVLYSLATEHPGAMCLHNFPELLRRIDKNPEDGIFLDLAAVDVFRDRERGVPRYADFRRLIGCRPPKTFADITDNKDDQKLLEEVYGTVDRVDLLIGCLAEAGSARNWPPRFGFSDTAFRIFIVMASRRLKSDRFFTDDFTPEIYTKVGFDWVQNNGFFDVLARHAPGLAGHFSDVRNPFFPWARGA